LLRQIAYALVAEWSVCIRTVERADAGLARRPTYRDLAVTDQWAGTHQKGRVCPCLGTPCLVRDRVATRSDNVGKCGLTRPSCPDDGDKARIDGDDRRRHPWGV